MRAETMASATEANFDEGAVEDLLVEFLNSGQIKKVQNQKDIDGCSLRGMDAEGVAGGQTDEDKMWDALEAAGFVFKTSGKGNNVMAGRWARALRSDKSLREEYSEKKTYEEKEKMRAKWAMKKKCEYKAKKTVTKTILQIDFSKGKYLATAQSINRQIKTLKTCSYFSLHYTTSHYTTRRHTSRHYATLRYATLHDTTLHHTTRHHAALNHCTQH